MIAVLNTASACSWARQLGKTPWPLLPVANRPLLDYWLETCSEMGVRSIHVVLGDQSKQIEDFIGDGARWNVEVQYAFARPGEASMDYLRSITRLWQEGLFYLGGPFFMRRRKAFNAAGLKSMEACRHEGLDETLFLFGRSADDINALLNGDPGSARGLEQIHVHPFPLSGIGPYFDLNMNMVLGEFMRYTVAGFSTGDRSSIGYNVNTPPSSHLQAPLFIGDDCRFGSMTSVGPNAVVGNHVIVDSYTELANCLILPDTYIGRNLEIRNKIVSGNRVVSPDDGTVVEIDDSWVVAHNRPDMRTEDFVRYCILWFITLGMAVVQLVPFLVLYPMVRFSRIAKYERPVFHDPRTGYIALPVLYKLVNRPSLVFSLFKALSLDRLPLLLRVLAGKLFLCGQPPMRHPEDDEIIKQLPHYYPGVFCYQDYNKDSDRLVDALWYAHIRSLFEDLKILTKALVSRFLRAGR
jgi:hypothetical protein